MSNIMGKIHQIRFRWGSSPDLTGGAYSAPPDQLAGFKDKERYINRSTEYRTTYKQASHRM